MKTVITLTIVHSKPLPDITDVLCQRVWPYGGGCITDMTAAIQEPVAPSVGEPVDIIALAEGCGAQAERIIDEHGVTITTEILFTKIQLADLIREVITLAVGGAQEPDEAWPVGEIVECEKMGQQTVREIDGRWRFLPIGAKLYATPPAAPAVTKAGSATIRVGNETFSKERMREPIKAGRAQS